MIADFFGARNGGGFRESAGEKGEFIAAQTVKRIRCAAHRGQPSGYLIQQQISRIMAIGIVDLFEAV